MCIHGSNTDITGKLLGKETSEPWQLNNFLCSCNSNHLLDMPLNQKLSENVAEKIQSK
jgi:hypothetical protein